MSSPSTPPIRRPKAGLKTYNTNIFHLRNPWVIAWWSLTFPGFGHLACGSTAKGIFLFAGELIINQMARINQSILYSFNGEFVKATAVLNTQWLLLYCAVLVFSIWDSYRIAVEGNKFSVLGDREKAPITPTRMGSATLNVLEKKNPWVSMIWSLVIPGLGQLYNAQTVKAVFLLLTSTAGIIASHTLQAIGYTAMGDFHQAKAILDWQIFINLPSFYGFAAWEAYVDSVEINKLFDIEQAQYFRNNFQSPSFNKPLPYKGGS